MISIIRLKLNFWVLLLPPIFIFFPSCSNFNAASRDNGNGALQTQQLAVKSSGSSALMDKLLSFIASGHVFSGSEIYEWSHTLVDSLSGATLASCVELAGKNSALYSLTCARAGMLTVKLLVHDGTVTFGPAFTLQTVYASVPTPTATPLPTATPVPSGPNAIGSQLYATSCAGCHGSLSNNNISSRTVSGVTSAIANIGQMQNITLSASEIQSIVNALNGK